MEHLWKTIEVLALHDGCTCNVQQGDTYCNDACRNAKTSGGCACGHGGCGGKK